MEKSGEYLGEISALCFLHLPPPSLPYLLAGTGSELLLYDLVTGNMIASFQVFKGVRVHGISCLPSSNSTTLLTFKVVVFGERCVKLFVLTIQSTTTNTTLLHLLSSHSFPHWVLDVAFIQEEKEKEKEEEGSEFVVAIGCTNNTVYFWDTTTSTIIHQIIVWKVVSGNPKPNATYEAVLVCRLAGHEGSIFRITWSSDASKLLSVSDDRSARIWEVSSGKTDSNDVADRTVSPSTGPVLFGHNARVWDCCMSDSFIITVGEDCTCRVWGLDGTQLRIIKEHIGRGVWRCLYDSHTSLLVTAGFDSAIKVHQLHSSLSMGLERSNEYDRKQIFTIEIPNSKQTPLMDSKSEYVRCMHFASEDALYVTTNNGFLYLAKISDTGGVVWTQLFQGSEEIPIVCMSVLSEDSSCVENWIALGDGKGRLTVVRVADIRMPKVNLSFTWPAEAERQLLGTYWCKSLGHRYIFTADPRGRLKLWSICNSLQSISEYETGHTNASLVAEFTSCFPIRIICLDASFQEEVLVCGDLRGNLVLFPLLRDLLHGPRVASVAHISPSDYFKGAHGISSVRSVSIHGSNSSNVELHSTGADGCICYMEYDRCKQRMEFIGMKQVKELSLVQSLFHNDNLDNNLGTGNYAVGFASADFIIWNLSTDTKVAVIPCGGWRRPHAYFLGDIPEMNNCFAFVKDEVIYIHKHLVPTSDRIYPQNLHLQFHGREMHSLCFIDDLTQSSSDEKLFRSSSIATGCEDGTVRLTRYTYNYYLIVVELDLDNPLWCYCYLSSLVHLTYVEYLKHKYDAGILYAFYLTIELNLLSLFKACLANDADGHRYSSGVDNWSASNLLGEHVGGSAVRSLCSVLKVHIVVDDTVEMPATGTALDDQEDQFLLISVGAKRVLTAWKRKISSRPETSMSFQWLSSDFPTRNNGTSLKGSKEKINGNLDNVSIVGSDRASDSLQTELCCSDGHENDWRYLAVTAFLVKLSGSRISVCFVVVSCSDATVTLRALVLPHRLWFDIALLVPSASPVLSLQHVIVPELASSKDKSEMRSLFIVISGSTDGSIGFWDLTEVVESFMRKVSVLQKEDCSTLRRRPRTGRGSQGGRQWRSLEEKPAKTLEKSDRTSSNIGLGSSEEIDRIWGLHVVNNVHQSGVNCLHVSYDGESCIVISGGDDQALHCFYFDVMILESKYQIVISHAHKIASAHSSAVKGVWTDGKWVFSTGLDQRVRCWAVSEHGKLSEHAHFIVSVPEPEALDVRLCGSDDVTHHHRHHLRNRYQIAVAGRGMQMLEFSR
ncbi:hypothetical protein OSB04_020122 [Centaurea solstitialis]|uniref:WD repeat-containing protein 6 n=1 Tax=Centaurea solstitialis TaxID=347529 RepID=A0AA38WEX8_9ASTR|nr:hypothetical protein OSB04_020122 [Centaurea solstitialis]